MKLTPKQIINIINQKINRNLDDEISIDQNSDNYKNTYPCPFLQEEIKKDKFVEALKMIANPVWPEYLTNGQQLGVGAEARLYR